MVQKNSLKKFVLVIVGPTASGKSSFAIECAKHFNGVIISADSMQIYKEMNIGTAKPSKEEMQGIEHKLIGSHSLKDSFSAAEFSLVAKTEIEKAYLEGKIPIIVGGTGLFVQSFMYNYDFNQVKQNPEKREEINKLIDEKGLAYVYDILKEKSPERALKIHPNDKIRIVRALEVLEEKTEFAPKKEIRNDYDFLLVGTNLPRELLYERINNRVDEMIKNGLIKEIDDLIKSGYEQYLIQSKAIGYKEFLPFIHDEKTLEECSVVVKQMTRNYAKRQLTWFRAMKEIIWFNPLLEKEQILEMIKDKVNKYEKCN
ncbi:MAG: tRNA (adenosine(37)-N6)-dimethylallyltransferase MiaA [Clostridia bacterium]